MRSPLARSLDNIPKQIGKYEILRRLGSGGMAVVYHGIDRRLNREVAIKVRKEDELNREQLEELFLREARAVAKLRHGNIVGIFEISEHEGQPFIAMEYVDGKSLATVIVERQQKTLHEKLAYLEQICDGLGHAHANGIIHRDIKPPNLMLDRHDQIRIVDFGIVHLQDSGMTNPGAVIGTYNYMSPEQIGGVEIDKRSDIFSVGAVAYELLAYRQAFPGRNLLELSQLICEKNPTSLTELCPEVPDDLEKLVLRALAKRPEERFPDLSDMRLAIRQVQRTLDPRFELKTIFVPQVNTILIPSGTPRGVRASSVGPLPSDAALSGVAVSDGNGSLSLSSAAVPSVDAASVPSATTSSLSSRQWLLWSVGFSSVLVLAVALWVGSGNLFSRPGGSSAPLPENAASAAAPAPAPATTPPKAADPLAGIVTPAPVAAAPGPATAPAAPAATPTTPVVTPPLLTSIRSDVLARINTALKEGDVAGAFRLIEPTLEGKPDEQALSLGRRIAERSIDSMVAAQSAATTHKAGELARAPFSTGAQSRILAERAFARNDYLQAGRQALAAAASFRKAEDDALAAAPAAANSVPSGSTPVTGTGTAPASASSAVTDSRTVADTPPAPAASPAATNAPATPVTPTPKPFELDSAGILSALNRYKAAYSARDVDAMRKIYPSLPRQEVDRLRKNFNTCKEVNVNFSGIQPSAVADDPTSAVVTVRSTYFCQPRINAPAQEVPQDDVFRLRNVGGTWLIDRMGAMDPLR